MKKNEKTTVDDRSKSQIKREARKQEVLAARKTAKKNKVIGIAVTTIVICLLALGIGSGIYQTLTTTTASSDYSAGLTNEGLINGIDVSTYVTTIDYNNINVALADVEYSDEEVDADILTELQSHEIYNMDETRLIVDGDTVALDYVGTIDGVEFEGGSSNGEGDYLTIGSGSFVDDFETQLIGAAPGDILTVEVTFPDDYSSEELAGEDAVFEVTINAVYDLPEFNDEFVVEYLYDYADTAEDYRTYLKQTNYDTSLESYIDTLITENSTVSSYYDSYIKLVKSVQKYSDTQNYLSINEMYSSYLGYELYSSLYEYMALSKTEYEDYLLTYAQEKFASDCAYQYIFFDAGLTISDDTYAEALELFGDGAEEAYGTGFIMQLLMKEAVLGYLAEIAIVS